MNLLITIFLFILGSILGSFVNVVIYRLPRKISIVKPRSHCTSCNNILKWYENIPILSYIILKGRCAYCGKSFSPRYLIVELLSGISFVVLYQYNNDIWNFTFIAMIMLLFIAIIFIDYEHYIIPDILLIPLFFISIIHFLINHDYSLLDQLISGLIVSIILFLIRLIANIIYKKEALGLGDVKLGFLIGFLLGWNGALVAIFIGFCIASISIVLLMIKKKVRRNSYIPLGPFMIFGMLTYILWGTELVEWYLNVFMR